MEYILHLAVELQKELYENKNTVTDPEIMELQKAVDNFLSFAERIGAIKCAQVCPGAEEEVCDTCNQDFPLYVCSNVANCNQIGCTHYAPHERESLCNNSQCDMAGKEVHCVRL